MKERVARTLLRRGMLEAGRRIGVAVSGGADSVALVEVLAELAPEFGLELSVIHLNHCLRGAAADEDQRFVEALAAKCGLRYHVRAVDVAAEAAARGDNLEQAARRERLAFFRSLIESGAMDRVATAHTRSDQAETVLYRILRGSGPAGLAGILPVTREGLIRPLIDVPREDVLTWLGERGSAWREDESNRDTHFARNRLRIEVLPRLRAEFNPRLDEALAGLAEVSRAEEEYWKNSLPAYRLLDGVLVVEAREFTDADEAVARRRVRVALAAVKGDLRGFEFAHVERVLALAASRQGSGRVQLPGVDVFRSFEWIRFAPAGFDYGIERNFELPAAVPSEAVFPDGTRIALRLEEKSHSSGCDTVRMALDWRKVLEFQELQGDRLAWRNWQPGDRYRSVASAAAENLKTQFERARVPLWERRRWPVLTCGNEILWTRRFGPAWAFAASNGSGRVLDIRDEHA